MKRAFTLIAVVCSIVCANAQGKPLTAGNIVIYRVGDGSTTLGTSAAPVFIDEYSTATTLSGTAPLVQSIPLPSKHGTAPSGSYLLTAQGTSGTEGLITRSVDGNYIVFAGYDSGADTSTASVSASASKTTARVIGRIDATGTVNTTTGLTNFASAYGPRAVVSPDGNTFYLTSGTSGIYSTTLGVAKATKVSVYSASKSPTGVHTGRALEIFNDSIYVSSATTYLPDGIGTQAQDIAMATIGSLNTIATDTATTVLPGVDTIYPNYTPDTRIDPYQFVMLELPGGRVLYIADHGSNSAIQAIGIQKYSLVSGTWIYNGSIHALACQGLTGYNNGTNNSVELFATSKTSLFGALDISGYNAAPNCPTDSAVVLATAPANTFFRGIAFTPGALPGDLPIAFRSFNGSLVNGYANLSWTTATETNSKGFEIEKSKDGKNFSSIGYVPANNKPASYEFSDPTKLAGLQYYRLKVTNKDGSNNYSSIVALNDKVSVKLSVYPNPVANTATISHREADANAVLKITSIDGKTITTYTVQTGATETSVDVSRLVKGSYIVSFENNNTKTVTQFVK